MEDYLEGFSEEISKWENIKDLAEQEISEKRSDHKNEASVQFLPRRYITLFGFIPKMEQKIYSKCKQCRMVFNPRDVLSHKNCVGKVATTLPQSLKKKVKSKKVSSSSGYSTNSNSTNNSNNNSTNTGSSNSSLVLKQKMLSKKYINTRSVIVSSATSTSSPSTSTFTPEPTPSTSVVVTEAETSSENVGSTTSPDFNDSYYHCMSGGNIPIEEYLKNMETKKRRSKKSSKSHQTTHKSKASSSSSSSSSKPSSVAVSSTSSSVGTHTRSSSSYNSSSATTSTSTSSKAQPKAIMAAADSTETILEQTHATPSPPSASSSPSSSSSSSNKCSSKSRRGYKSKKVTTPSTSTSRSKEAASSSDRKTAREKDLNLKQTNSSYTLPQEKQQQMPAQVAPKSKPSLPPPPPPPPPKQHLGKQRGSASLKENETKKRVAEEENVTFCQSTSYVPIVATNASTDESTVSTTTTYVPIIEETDENTTTHSRQTTSIYKSTANKKTNQIKTDVSDSSKNLENGYSNSQDGAIGTVPVVYEPMSPISVQFVKIGKKMICLESPQSAMSPPLPIRSVFFTIPDQQPASNNNTIKFFKSHPKPATIPTFGARRLDGAILVSHHQLRSKRDDILKAVLNKSTKNTPHRPNILKDDKSEGKVNFKRTAPDEFHSNDNCKQTRLTPDVNGFILHADMSESADAPQPNNCIQKKTPLNIK